MTIEEEKLIREQKTVYQYEKLVKSTYNLGQKFLKGISSK